MAAKKVVTNKIAVKCLSKYLEPILRGSDGIEIENLSLDAVITLVLGWKSWNWNIDVDSLEVEVISMLQPTLHSKNLYFKTEVEVGEWDSSDGNRGFSGFDLYVKHHLKSKRKQA